MLILVYFKAFFVGKGNSLGEPIKASQVGSISVLCYVEFRFDNAFYFFALSIKWRIVFLKDPHWFSDYFCNLSKHCV